MKKTMKTAFAVMAVSVMALTACGPFHPSKDLASDAAIEKSIDGLEKLDDKKTEQFLQAVNKKYAVTINDVSAAVDMEMVLSVDLGEVFGGSDFDIPLRLSAAEFSMDQAGNSKYTDLALQISIPLLGNISLKGDGYTDAAEEYNYSFTKEFTMEGGLLSLAGDTAKTSEDLNRWIRKKTEKKPDAETEKTVISLDPQKVSGVYINKNNGSYIVDIAPEIVNDLQDHVEITGTENAKCLLSFDKGLALAGLWVSADVIHMKTDTEEVSELDVKDPEVTLDLLSMNSGIDLKVPDDVKSAAVDQDADDETPMDMIEGIL